MDLFDLIEMMKNHLETTKDTTCKFVEITKVNVLDFVNELVEDNKLHIHELTEFEKAAKEWNEE